MNFNFLAFNNPDLLMGKINPKKEDPIMLLKDEKDSLERSLVMYNEYQRIFKETDHDDKDYILVKEALEELAKENPNFLEDTEKRLEEIKKELGE